MLLRAQPPVHSPLSLTALAGGVLSRIVGADQARASVVSALAAVYDPRALLLTDSGTTALSLAIALAARERPGPVALPAFCCYDIATAADGARVPFALYDIDAETLAPDLASLSRVLDAGATSVVLVHLFGIPLDLDAIAPLLKRSGALLIEDAAQAAGTRIGARPAGAVGRYGVLSFGRGKGMTGGRGGALLANEADAAAAVAEAGESLTRAPGGGATPLLAQWILARPALYGLPASLPFLGLGETVYHPPHAPAHAPAFALGVLARTLPLALAEAPVRRTHARRLLDAIAASEGLRGYTAPRGTDPGYLRLPVLVAESMLPASRSRTARRLGIWPSYPQALADLPGFGERRINREATFAGARTLASRLVTLPTHGYLGSGALDALERWIARPS